MNSFTEVIDLNDGLGEKKPNKLNESALSSWGTMKSSELQIADSKQNNFDLRTR